MDDTQSELDLAWGADEIADELNLEPRQVYHMLKNGTIKAARRIGGRWCADRNLLRRQFTEKMTA